MVLVAALAFRNAMLGYPVGIVAGIAVAGGIWRLVLGPIPTRWSI
jgi:hypothetical protein